MGSMLCILAYSSPAGFSLLIVLSCAFIFCREKNPYSLCWKEMLWTKWSQYCCPLQRLASSGLMLSEKRHVRDNTEFDVFKLPDNHHEFLLLLVTDLLLICFSFNWSWCESDVCAAEEMPLPSVPHVGHLEDDCPLTLQGVTGTGVEQTGVKESSCLLLSHTLHWPISSGCMQYSWVQNNLQERLLLKLLT